MQMYQNTVKHYPTTPRRWPTNWRRQRSSMDDAKTQTYNEVRKLVFHTCHKFAAQYGRGDDWDEMVGEANLAFCLAVQRYKRNRGSKFSSWVRLHVWYRLLDLRKSQIKRILRMPTVPLIDGIVPDGVLPNPVSMIVNTISKLRERIDARPEDTAWFVAAQTARRKRRVLVCGPYRNRKIAQFEIREVAEFVRGRAAWISLRNYTTLECSASFAGHTFFEKYDLQKGR